MSNRMNQYVMPEDDRMYRFHLPISHFKSYARDMEEYLLKQQIQSYDSIEKSEHEREREEEYVEQVSPNWLHFLSESHMYLVEFPNIHRSSLLMSIYSFLENQLIRLCKDLQNKNQYSIKFNSINGKGIEKAKVYLQDVVKLDFPSNSKEWHDINAYKNIRNSFAHSEGNVNENDKKLMNSIERLDFVSITGDIVFGKNIVLGKEFIPSFIETIKIFWLKIDEQYLELLYPWSYYK